MWNHSFVCTTNEGTLFVHFVIKCTRARWTIKLNSLANEASDETISFFVLDLFFPLFFRIVSSLLVLPYISWSSLRFRRFPGQSSCFLSSYACLETVGRTFGLTGFATSAVFYQYSFLVRRSSYFTSCRCQSSSSLERCCRAPRTIPGSPARRKFRKRWTTPEMIRNRPLFPVSGSLHADKLQAVSENKIPRQKGCPWSSSDTIS